MGQRRAISASDGLTERFDLGDEIDEDGPTVLPPPWSEPPDPEFLTGTVPRLVRADLSGELPPGMEPSDSSQMTVRFSREEVRALVGVRLQTGRVPKSAAAPRAARPPEGARPGRIPQATRPARSPQATRPARLPEATRDATPALALRPAGKSRPLSPRAVPRASVPAPVRASVPAPVRESAPAPAPAAWRAVVSRINGRHITLGLALGSAFALGVLTGILAMS